MDLRIELIALNHKGVRKRIRGQRTERSYKILSSLPLSLLYRVADRHDSWTLP
jgi:hypothetical protein